MCFYCRSGKHHCTNLFQRMDYLRQLNNYRFRKGMEIGATLKFGYENPEIGIRDSLIWDQGFPDVVFGKPDFRLREILEEFYQKDSSKILSVRGDQGKPDFVVRDT